jgi:putative effector of murein hydrolase
MKTMLRGQFRRVIINPILVSILFLFAQVRISNISDKYAVRIKAEDIQSFA